MSRKGAPSSAGNNSALTTKNETVDGKILAVEHRCFFNELYRQNWDARNKLIKARHDKIKQGLVAESGIMTDLTQSQLYEGFTNVFQTETSIPVSATLNDTFDINLERGMHSGHLKLTV
jgi:hypothetical protein